jgi:hypothetical protein
LNRPETGGFFLDVKNFVPLAHMRFEGVIMNPPHFLSIPVAFCLFAGGLLFHATDAQAEFYKYKDSGGNLVITNKLADVPRKYRGRVKVIWDDELEAKDPLARRQAAAERQREQREQQQIQQERQKPAGLKTPDDGKTLVITIDEQTGEVIRRFE